MSELMNMPKTETSADAGREDATTSDNRRAALAKMGLFAAYTAPMMLGMMTAAKAQVASGQQTTEIPR